MHAAKFHHLCAGKRNTTPYRQENVINHKHQLSVCKLCFTTTILYEVYLHHNVPNEVHIIESTT